MGIFDFLGDSGISDYAIPAAIVGSALIGSNAAGEAAAAQTRAASDSGQTQLAIYNQSRADAMPYTETGTQGLYSLADLYGVSRPLGPQEKSALQARVTAGGQLTPAEQAQLDSGFSTGKAFQGTPGYQFRLDEGYKALDRSAASRGMLRSGAQMKAISDYGQNTASSEFQNYTNALRSLAGLGQTTQQGQAGIGANTGANIGASMMAGGNARASAYTGGAQAINQGVGNALYYYTR
jgi:hypothetical protein